MSKKSSDILVVCCKVLWRKEVQYFINVTLKKCFCAIFLKLDSIRRWIMGNSMHTISEPLNNFLRLDISFFPVHLCGTACVFPVLVLNVKLHLCITSYCSRSVVDWWWKGSNDQRLPGLKPFYVQCLRGTFRQKVNAQNIHMHDAIFLFRSKVLIILFIDLFLGFFPKGLHRCVH